MSYSTSRGSQIAKVILGVIATLAVIGGIIWAIIDYNRNRAAQRDDFKADLAAVGFANADPEWEDESKHGKTESALEANVIVAGCMIELERASGEESIAGTVQNRQIEAYTVDEANHGRKEIEIDDFPGQMASAADIERFLRQHGTGRFPCLVPAR